MDRVLLSEATLNLVALLMNPEAQPHQEQIALDLREEDPKDHLEQQDQRVPPARQDHCQD
ncbi:hypothetical protein C1752_03420 [Acaryochloris thomasi RCC1774]|uniref:Uncharacterized protein n=1 Tax=Acaryochloris thomasi RCC1774 TaxID=1764569 RepID=A0A2W1JR88_9CYAN|nr:hypothetical protein C1752_03420 [Acaryochloris thomasi RCC1774]